ncbi:MAG: hypothetical protein VB141_13675 [Burkholderia gladioli]
MTQRNIILTLTDSGRKALIKAADNGVSVKFSHLALGAGMKALGVGSEQLTDEKERQPIFSASQIAPGQLRISALFDADPAAVYKATELALIGDGVVVGVWSTTDANDALVVRTPGVPYTGGVPNLVEG